MIPGNPLVLNDNVWSIRLHRNLSVPSTKLQPSREFFAKTPLRESCEKIAFQLKNAAAMRNVAMVMASYHI